MNRAQRDISARPAVPVIVRVTTGRQRGPRTTGDLHDTSTQQWFGRLGRRSNASATVVDAQGVNDVAVDEDAVPNIHPTDVVGSVERVLQCTS